MITAPCTNCRYCLDIYEDYGYNFICDHEEVIKEMKDEWGWQGDEEVVFSPMINEIHNNMIMECRFQEEE